MQAVFEKLKLITPYGNAIDLNSMVVEFNVYQNIYKHYMECEIVLADTIGLQQSVPQDIENKINGGFTGAELLLAQYYSENNPIITNLFVMYKTSGKVRKDNTEVYILSGISLEGMEAFPRKISQAFGGSNGTTVEQMLKSVYDKFVYSNAVKNVYNNIKDKHKTSIKKELYSEKTNGVHKFIIPNLTVDNTINFLCNEADSDDHIPRFVFFENYNGFYFTNISTLISTPVTVKYTYSEFNTTVGDQDQLRIVSYNIKKESDLLELSRNGLFKSKMIHLDLHQKKKTETVFDYQTQFPKFKTLQNFKHSGDVSSSEVNVTMMTTRHGHDQNSLFYGENHKPKKIDRTINSRKSYVNHIHKNIMNVSVPGTTTLNVGDIVYLSFPFNEFSGESQDVVENLDISGKYIILEVRNKIEMVDNQSTFMTYFKCAKDTQVQG